MANPFVGTPLDYLIANDAAQGAAGHITEPGYDPPHAPAGDWILYGNLRDQEGNQSFGPYLERTKTDDVGRQYGEWGPDPAGDGFWRLIDKQITRGRSLGAPCIEWDNIDTYDAAVALAVFERTQAAGLRVAVKNPNAVQGDTVALLRHPAAALCIVECDSLDGESGPSPSAAPAYFDKLRRAAGRPDMPIRFVGFNDPDDGDPRGDAERCAKAAASYSDIGVTFSP